MDLIAVCDLHGRQAPAKPRDPFSSLMVDSVVRQFCVSNAACRAVYIALQRENAYQGKETPSLARMMDRPQGLPEEALELPLVGFNLYVGPLYRLPDGDGGALRRFTFVIADKHMNAAGSAHGGMLMTLADVAMSQSARLETGANGVNTVSLNCDFVGPGRLGDLAEARVRVSRRARTMVFQSAELYAGDRLLLVATGLWKIVVES
jgi:acyl-coenzyme A thioesterase 13